MVPPLGHPRKHSWTRPCCPGNYTPLFSSVYPGLSWFILVYPGLSRFIPVYPGLSRFIPVYSGLSRFIPVYPGLSWFIPVYPGLSWFIPVYPGLSWFIPVYPGLSRFVCVSVRTKQLITDALLDNDFLKELDLSVVMEICEFMYRTQYSAEQRVIQEGAPGEYLYVLTEGVLEVEQSGRLLGQMFPGTAFGELAILYNCKRTATVRGTVWTLDRQSFQSIVRRTTQQRHLEHCSFLPAKCPMNSVVLLCDWLLVFAQECYDKGEFIIREGEEGDTFFIISRGQVRHAGSLKNLQSSVIRIHTRHLQLSGGVTRGSPVPDPAEATELNRLRARLDLLRRERPLEQLQLIATLGTGGFGRVELVKLEDEPTAFALKVIKKQLVVENRQQQHVYSEKTLLQEIHCPFITRFFRTFRDQKFVYLLLEACLGGELWTVLRDTGFFDESTARFCCGCVLEALEYLQQRNIIYRDLKPENLLLDQDGYLKLADFGFAKRLVCGRKTWTFCGTPEYVAPEVILNRGHDAAVDLWATGILLYELLTGSPPFSGSDPIKIYTSILRGVEKMDFSKKIRKRADDLIRRLCRLNPVERLGNNKNGINDIKKHK
uniref:cGMP-dependent protein kinase n=1 Tax=Neogobius melanostomus TaxID=47308 RepID=A0A8C6WNQ2_9GOBI